ncbi:hypothetical protein PF006_g711 [Phytophthora fragariae]|uniref:Uncharacterized protein n=1 Tax=Phytophthora fragariae TaxID=53985 RepID=A0A6A3UW96_9STRA|nr:hypothetical protein PF006_g711 [Phytophthora fragariae]KAE9361531.1 hypothetical protein PF008_g947 [Phytophthora fragariae]
MVCLGARHFRSLSLMPAIRWRRTACPGGGPPAIWDPQHKYGPARGAAARQKAWPCLHSPGFWSIEAAKTRRVVGARRGKPRAWRLANGEQSALAAGPATTSLTQSELRESESYCE